MIHLIQLTTYSDCLTPKTQLIISPKTNTLSLILLKAEFCNFPQDVQISLRFSSQPLDVQTVLTNYSSLKNTPVTFQVDDVTPYLQILAVTLTIRSYSAQYQHEVLEILILRADENQVIRSIESAIYDGFSLTVKLQINHIEGSVKAAEFDICTNKCFEIESVSVEQLGNDVTLTFIAEWLAGEISEYGIQSKQVRIHYGGQVLSVAKNDDFSLKMSYQIDIGELQEAFLYEDQVFVSIATSVEFQVFIRLYQTVGISFFYDVCDYSIVVSTQVLRGSGSNIDVVFGKKLFQDAEEFLACQSLAYYNASVLQMNMNFSSIMGTTRYELKVETTRSCFHNTNFSIYNNDLSIQTEVLPNCSSSEGSYLLQIQSYATMTDQTIDNKIVLYEVPIILEGKTSLKISLKQNKSLQSEVTDAYSVFFVLVSNDIEVDDSQMFIKIIKINDFLFYIGIMIILQMIITVLVTLILLFVKPKPRKRRRSLKNLQLEDI